MTYLQITLKIAMENRAAAAAVYHQYKPEFIAAVPGARSKDLLVRDEDVQVLHGFDSRQSAHGYLSSTLFSKDVVGALSTLLAGPPELRIYDVA